jgi:HNH endonuclease
VTATSTAALAAVLPTNGVDTDAIEAQPAPDQPAPPLRATTPEGGHDESARVSGTAAVHSSPGLLDGHTPVVENCLERLRPTTQPRSAVSPLSSDHYKLQLTISRDTHDKLRRAQDLLRHTIPTGDVAALIDRALTLLLADLERRRCAATPAPRVAAGAGTVRSRHIPASVRRQVWQRDLGRCAFVGTSGRCRETGFLEFHHVEPYADGGPATVENIQLRCRAHNLYEAGLFCDGGADRVKESVAAGW